MSVNPGIAKAEIKTASTAEKIITAGPAVTSSSSARGRLGQLEGRVLISRADPDAEITVELENPGLNYDQSLSVERDGTYYFADVPTGRGFTISAFENGEQKDNKTGMAIHAGVNHIALLRIPEPIPDENVRVYGKVFDEQNQPVGGVQVKLQSGKQTVDLGAVTSPNGDFSFTEVPPSDDYKLSVLRNNVVFATQAENVAPRRVNPEHIVILYLNAKK
jgi:hypothetical protein